jgi:thiol-activated cytolysin
MRNSKTALSLLILLLVGLSQCKDKSEDPNIDPLEQALLSGGTFEDPEEETEVKDSATEFKTENGQRWKCTRKKMSVKAGIGGDGGFPMFNPNSNVIYPGSLLQGKSLRNATPDVIAVDRSGGTVSYDIVDGNETSSFTVDQVKKSTITSAMNGIIGGSTGTLPANFTFSYTNVQSRKQFALEVNADFENAFVELEASLSLETDNSYNHYLVRLDQIYYTMSFDIPTNKEQLFAESVTPEDLNKYVGPGNPACYVSDVTYGRIYYMLIESKSSVLDMEAAISGSFNSIAASGGADLETSYFSSLNSLKIKVFAYGGESSGSLETIGNIDPSELAEKLAKSGDIKNGKPLSYVARSAYDNRIVAMPVTTEFDVVTCTPVGSGNTPPAATSHWSEVKDRFGAIGAAINLDFYNNEIALFNKAGDRYLLSKNGSLSGPFEISDLGDANCPISNISCAGAHIYLNGSTVTTKYTFFNDNGNYYAEMSKSGAFGSERSIGSFGLGKCPFNAEGIAGFAYTDNYHHVLINKNGDQFAIYDARNKTWSGKKFLYDFDSSSECPLKHVASVCHMRIGALDYNVFFNTQGTQYCLYNITDGFSPIYDL